MNLSTALAHATRKLADTSQTPRLDSLLLLSFLLDQPKAYILAHGEDQKLTRQQHSVYEQLIVQRLQHTPIAYILGKQQFYGYDFLVNEQVLIPRPETETLIEYAIEHAPHAGSVVDVGSGSGAIAIALKKQRPDLHLYAGDISTTALNVARENARIHSADIEFTKSDLLSDWDQQFDIIAANLPYLPLGYECSPQVSYEPEQALFAGEDGLTFYRRLLPEGRRRLTVGGVLLIEHLPAQSEALNELALHHGYQMNKVDEFVSALKVGRGAPHPDAR